MNRIRRGTVERAQLVLTLAALAGAQACSSSSDETTPGTSTGTGGAGTGGAKATGGTGAGTGGAKAAGTGGANATGGFTAMGGSPATGGTSTTGSGGGVSKGGTGAGGKAGGTGGSTSGGATSSGGSSAGNGNTSGGTSGAASGGASTAGSGSGGEKASSGCGSTKAPMSGRFDIDVGGKTREYILAVPDDYDANEPYRLVFGWHPLGGSADQVAKGGYYGLEREADGQAIFVAAEGLAFQGGNLGWANTNGQDLAFLEAMLGRFRSELCIDENRIFSTGFSFGGMMSFAVGCGSGVMRAIAPMAGNIQVSGCEDGTQSVAVMGFHGTEDTVVAIDGGRAGRDIFVERNQCTEQSTPVTPSWCDGLSASNEPCNCVSYQGCKAGYPVIWCEFNGPHTPAPNSAATIWDFFSQF